MAADPQRHEAPSNDLFGRWLAHHEQQSPDPDEPTGSSEGTLETAPGRRASRRLPAAAVASSAVQGDPMIGSRIAAPSSFGSRRPAAGAGSGNDVDREPPAGWEPIVMRSARTKVEQAEAKKTPKPDEHRGRLQRLKARLVDPPAENSEETAVEPEEPVLVTPPPALPTPPLPTRAPAAQPPVARSIEETIRAAVAPAVPAAPARHAEPVHPVEQVQPVGRVEPVQPVPARHVQQAEPAEVPVLGHAEPEEVAHPAAVRAFIDAAPLIVEPEPDPHVAPEPVAFEPEPEPEPVAFEPEPEPVAVEPVAFEPEPVLEARPVIEPFIEPVPEPEPVVASVTEIEPEPIAPRDLPEAEAPAEPEEPAARFSFLQQLKRQSQEPTSPSQPKGRRDPARAAGTGTGDVARDLVAGARARATVSTHQPLPEPATEAAPAPVAIEAPPEPEAAPAPAPVSKHEAVAEEMPGLYKFTPKRTSRRLLTIAMMIGLVVTAYFVRAAIEIRDTPSIGLAAIVVLATAMVWAIRAGASVTKLEVHQGQLAVIQQGGRFVFDLASQYTNIEVHGQPGRRGWKVLFPRRGMAPFTVDASMVDPDDFMRVLRFFRPQLVHH